MTAEAIFKKYADKDGFIKLADILNCGWTKSKAESEGLIIKEDYKYTPLDLHIKYKKIKH